MQELSLEEKKELSQLSGYFKKLEITSKHLGIELDEYISEFRDNGYAQLVEGKANVNAPKRKEVFEKASRKVAVKAKSAKSK